MRLALPAVICMLVLAGAPSAQLTPQLFCQQMVGTNALTGNSIGSVTNMLAVSLLILLLMTNIAALTYLLGSAFKVDRLSRFGRAELGEVLLTAIIVVVFIGAFAGINSLPPPSNYISLYPQALPLTGSGNIFNVDCLSLAGSSFTVLGDIAPLYLSYDFVNFASGWTWGVNLVTNMGSSVRPLSGLSLSLSAISNITNILYALIFLPIAAATILGIFYAIGPLFLFLGIILRTIPWTRAAGGAFLGFFIAFFILFPLLTDLMVTTVSPAKIDFNTYTLSTAFQNVNPLGSLSLAVPQQDLGMGLLMAFIQNVAGQMVYIIFSVLISLLISFDFMEAAGDLLGAPSLSSSQSLKRLI